MYVLTLSTEQAIHYYDSFHERSIRPITMYLWTMNGMQEEDFDTYEDYAGAQNIKEITRKDLDTLEMTPYQEIRIDAAIWVQLMPAPKAANTIGVLSHKPYDPSEDPFAEEYIEHSPYVGTLLLYVNNRADADRLVDGLNYASDRLFGPRVNLC